MKFLRAWRLPAVLLAVSACGAEGSPVEPVQREVCTVRFLPDGQIECACVTTESPPTEGASP